MQQHNGDMGGVSCWNQHGCIAVGTGFRDDGSDYPKAERWLGRRWSPQRIPDPGGGSLGSVSCLSATFCVAVGAIFDDSGDDTGLFAEGWNGKRWSTLHAPDAGLSDSLAHVSCSSPMACTAVGSFSTDNGDERPAGGALERSAVVV